LQNAGGREMRARGIFLVALFCFGGCTSVPKVLRSEAVSSSEIVNAVQCEFMVAVARHPRPNWFAGIKLELDGTQGLGSNQTAFTATPVPAVRGPATFAPLVGGYTNTVKRTASIEFFAALDSYLPGTPTGEAVAARCPQSAGAGGLGLADWLEAVLGATDSSAARIKTINYQLDFTVTRSMGGGLTFKTSVVEIKIDKPSVTYNNTNKLTVSIVSTLPGGLLTVRETDDGFPGGVMDALSHNLDKLTEKPKPELVLVPGDTLVVQ
jgi:hypothetical protein